MPIARNQGFEQIARSSLSPAADFRGTTCQPASRLTAASSRHIMAALEGGSDLALERVLSPIAIGHAAARNL
ncbi:MAG: hypothetical protein OXG51_12595 [Gammaproteobacteria bacterium]|nr:hypothetical protein [Gammaproteobacteria bacterium]